MGDIKEVVGVVSHPWKMMRGESLACALLKFENGLPGTLHCHYNDIPMAEIPFFQIFGSQVLIHKSLVHACAGAMAPQVNLLL